MNEFCKDWKFLKSNENGAHLNDFDDSSWKEIDIPHDWSVEGEFDKENGEGCTGYLLGGLGWYRKNFKTTQKMKDEIVTVIFDGVYNNADFYINGEYLGFHPYGYSPVTYDISKYLKPVNENNVLSVRVDHTRYADSRWYTGSGIYREVKLDISPKIRIPIWGVKIESPIVTEKVSTVRVKANIENSTENESTVMLRTRIIDSNNKLVATTENSICVPQNSKKLVEQDVLIENPKLWCIETPNLYTAEFEVVLDGKAIQTTKSRFGIREYKFDTQTGFYLNGKNMKIKGVCLHHDAGLVGAAVTETVWRRRLNILKECGCNAIRSSHNPTSELFLDLCDEMGFLVQEEFFDEWDNPKDKRDNGNENKVDFITRGYGEHFQEWAKIDLQTTMLRDMNHTCIFQWSIGNEIEWTYPKYTLATGYFGADATGNYFWDLPPHSIKQIRENISMLPQDRYEIGKTAAKLAKWVKEIDITRPVIANCILPSASYESGYIDSLDMVGYSYRRVIYDYGHENYPDKPIMGTENVAQWHEWKAVLERPFVSGMFIWTGFDYLGEAGPGHKVEWPVKSANSGMVDFAGFPKPSYYMMKSLWNDNPNIKMYTQTLENSLYSLNSNNELEDKEKDGWQKRLWRWHKVNDFWNYNNGDKMVVEIYSNCDKIELFLNSKSLGVKHLSDFDDRIFKWCLDYEDGALTAVGYKDGKSVSDELVTEKTAESIILTVEDKDNIKVGDYVNIVAQLVDADGNPIRVKEEKISFNVKGNAEIVGVDNGAIDSVQPYKSDSCITNNGHCLIIVKVTGKDEIAISATTGKLKNKCSINAD